MLCHIPEFIVFYLNQKLELKKIEVMMAVMGFIWLPCSMNNWQAVVNTVMNL